MAESKRILLIDNDRETCELLSEIFENAGWLTATAQTPGRARELSTEQNFDLVISDVNLEADATGLDLLREMRDGAPVILITGFGTLDAAVEATREGAWDFISKPFKVEDVVATAARALDQNRKESSRRGQTQAESLTSQYESSGLVGRSPAMIDLYKEIA